MSLENLQMEWSVDSTFDQLNIEKEIVKVPKLHEKYLKYLSQLNIELHKVEKTIDRLNYLKYRYYLGKMDATETKELGWDQQQELVLRSDISMVLAADKELSNLVLHKKTLENQINFCQSVLKEINNRNWQIRAFIDWKKFSAGG